MVGELFKTLISPSLLTLFICIKYPHISKNPHLWPKQTEHAYIYVHPQDYITLSWVFQLPLLPLSASDNLSFSYHALTNLSHNIFLLIYQVLLFAPVKLLSQCSWLTKNWSLGFTEATVSQDSFNTQKKKTLLRHPIGTTQSNGSNTTRQRCIRQIQKAWRVHEKGAGGSRDEHRQASQQSTTRLTSMQLDSCFYQHELKAKQICWRERFIWRRH